MRMTVIAYVAKAMSRQGFDTNLRYRFRSRAQAVVLLGLALCVIGCLLIDHSLDCPSVFGMNADE
jgi:hypothetical protein